MNYESLLDDLKDHGRFCAWRYEDRNGRRTKVPYHPLSGEAAQSNDPDSFVSFSEAVQANGYDGFGIGIFNGLCAVMSNTTMTGRGLIARFLYASPPSRIGSQLDVRINGLTPVMTAGGTYSDVALCFKRLSVFNCVGG